MSRDLVRIKGGAKGFQLYVDSSAESEAVRAELQRKLEEHPEFFPKGTQFWLMAKDLDKSVYDCLKDILQGMELGVMENARDKAEQALNTEAAGSGGSRNKLYSAASSRVSAEGDSRQMMTVVNRTVRNGEEITSKGSVMICGNVNPGAKIVAAGSIDVRGKCRGIVHAGAAGDYQAFVVADRLMPMQICIANLIARSPDNPEKSEYAEKAYIKDGQIIIEPIER